MADDYREEDIIVPVRCPNCGGLNPPENKVCQLCSFRLAGAAPAPLPTVQPIVPSGSGPLDTPAAPPPAPPASPFNATPPPPAAFSQPNQPSPAATPPPPSPPPPAPRSGSGLASRLSATGSTAPSPADWLGDLRRNMGGDAPAADNRPLPPVAPDSPFSQAAPPPAAPPSAQDEERGYMVPPSPTTSPYRRDDMRSVAGEPTDWLSSLRSSATFNQPITEEGQLEDAEDITAVPDWLRNLNRDSGPLVGDSGPLNTDSGPLNTDSGPLSTDSGPLTSPRQSSRPAWLTGRDANETDTGALAAHQVADDADEDEEATELPPWLQGTDTLDPRHVAEYEAQASATNIPAWMQQPPEPAQAEAGNTPDFSDWFTNRAAPAPSPAAPAEPPAPPKSSGGFLSDTDAPAWLRDLATAPPPAVPAAPVVTSLAAPTEADVREEEEEEYAPQIAATAEIEDDGSVSDAPPTWLQSDAAALADTDTYPPLAEPAATTEIAAATAEITLDTPPRRTTTGGLINRDEELPPWLRMVSNDEASGDEEAAPAAAAPAAPISSDTGPTDRFFPEDSGAESDAAVPDWLRGIGRQPADDGTAAVQSLTAPVAEPIQQVQRVMTVRPPRPGAAEVLAQLAAAPSANTRTSSLEMAKGENVMSGVARYLLNERGIYLLTLLVMLLVVGGDLLFNFRPLGSANPAATPRVDNFYNVVNALPPNAAVLVAYDWDASRAAEMQPLAAALTCHLATKDARFATVSFVPTGPAFAQQVAAATVDRAATCASRRYAYGSDYVNLGYSAGGEFALRSMVGNIGSVFSNDYVNGAALSSLPIMKGINSLADYKLIIILEGDESYAHSWIEQVATQPGTPPILLGSPASVYPSLQPYITTNAKIAARFGGAVAGLADVSYYQTIVAGRKGLTQSENNVRFSLNALNFAYIFIALLIVIGNIVFLTRLVNRRK